MRRALFVLAGVCSALLAGCDEVGAPLVDRLPAKKEPMAPILPCTTPLACDPPTPSSDTHPLVDARPIDLAVCGVAKARTCSLRETTEAVAIDLEIATATADADADADAGTDAGSEPGDPPLSCTPRLDESPSPLFDDGGSACETLELIAKGGDHLISGLTLRSVNLSVRASRPTSLTLQDATLEAVFVDLQGPITLRVRDARAVDALRAVGSGTDAGRPQLELLNVDANRLETGTVEGSFGGSLHFDQVELKDAQLFADRVELQSFALDGGRIESEELTASDVQIRNATVAVSNGVLSAFRLSETTVERCDTLVLIAGQLLQSTLSPCSGPPVRVYATQVITSRVDGRFESDSSSWERVAFGSTADTQLVAFSSQLISVNFCSGAARPVLGGRSGVRCSRCDGWQEDSPPACLIAGSPQPTPVANYCELLDSGSFVVCPEPTPERNRPLDQPF